jgi:hypothetical protein
MKTGGMAQVGKCLPSPKLKPQYHKKKKKKKRKMQDPFPNDSSVLMAMTDVTHLK